MSDHIKEIPNFHSVTNHFCKQSEGKEYFRKAKGGNQSEPIASCTTLFMVSI